MKYYLVVFFTACCLVPLHNAVGCGVERWSVKELSDSLAKYINFTPVDRTVGWLTSLPTETPSSNAPRDTSEMHTYRVACFLRQFKLETDGDVHLVIEDTSDTSITMIAEIPDSACPDAIAGGHASQFAAARDSLIAITGKKPTSSWKYLPSRYIVSLMGVGYYDPPHGQTGKAPNNLEIHPVLAFNTYTPSSAPPPPLPADSISLVVHGTTSYDTTNGRQFASLAIHVRRPDSILPSVQLIRWEGTPPDTTKGEILAEFDTIAIVDSIVNFRDDFAPEGPVQISYTYAAQADTGTGWGSQSALLTLALDTVQLRFVRTPPRAGDSVTGGSIYAFAFQAESDSGARVRYSLDAVPADGISSLDTITGLFTYSPPMADSMENANFIVHAGDAAGRGVNDTFALRVLPQLQSGIARPSNFPPHSALLHVSPQPFSTTLSVSYSLPGVGAAQLCIYNALGKQIYVHAIAPTDQTGFITIDAAAFRSGVYFVVLQGRGVPVSSDVVRIE